MKKIIILLLVVFSTVYASDKSGVINDCKLAYEKEIYNLAVTICTEATLTYNDAKSAGILGMLYKNGLGTTKNGKRSLAMFKLAGAWGFIPANYWLSVYYRTGENGAEKNPSKSFYFCKEAANSGHKDAQFNLGNYYFEAYGTSQDYKLAVKYWKLASKQGVSDATLQLDNFCQTYSWTGACK